MKGQCVAALCMSAGLLFLHTAHGQVAAAEALFQDGRRLLHEGEIDAACLKLEESQRLEASSGTLLNLALCHERQGKLATAWAEYVAAAALARAQSKPERAAVAEEQAQRIEPSLPRWVVHVAELVEGMELVRDGVSMGIGIIDTAVPVDPGSHSFEARAPGHEPWQVRLEAVPGQTTTVTVPPLRKESPPPPQVPAPAPPAVGPTTTRARPRPPPGPLPDIAAEHTAAPAAGWLLGGAGVAAFGVGAYFGVRSLEAYDEAHRLCPSHAGCSNDAIDARDAAERDAWVANAGIAVGAVLVGVGTYFLITAGRSPGAREVWVRGRHGGPSVELAARF